ncbi:TetR family transcriptional regulator [Streptomyces sp. NPDC055105]|uniref:TetR family transcriptional regulator n=1 Tax=Streptomyces sp. NPDC055105 TaxID=3365719 RepID=UPI0037CF0B72
MAVKRDSERTRHRIASAALTEFSKKGFDGARIDAIARRARVSVRMIYHYFGDKRGLYQHVLLERMGHRGQEMHELSIAAGRIPQEHYAAISGDPHFVRLMQWEALTSGADKLADEENRRKRYAELAAHLDALQREGLLTEDLPAEMMLLLIIAVTTFPLSFPQVSRLVTGETPSTPAFEAGFAAALAVFGRLLEPLRGTGQPNAGPDHNVSADRGRQRADSTSYREPQSPGFLLNQATLALNKSLDRALLASGLTSAQWTIVWHLHQDDAKTASEIAKYLGTDVAATWRLVDRLVDKGLVDKKVDPTDSRVRLLELTPKARDRYPEWRATVSETVERLLAGVPPEAQTVLSDTMRTITHNARG